MADGLSTADRDSIVAAILSAPIIDASMGAEARLEIFRRTLEELTKRGGASRMWFDVPKP